MSERPYGAEKRLGTGALARLTGLNRKTVQHALKSGLVPGVVRTPGGKYRAPESTVAWLVREIPSRVWPS
jgi:predicted site-specific integrase-resolvase